VTRLLAVATYRPCYESASQRVAGPDEDLVTMAVSAAQPLLDHGRPSRVVLVSRQLERAPASAPAVIATALDLPETVPFERRLGGAATALEAVSLSPERTLVLTVDLGAVDSAAAALIEAGEGLRAAGRVRHGMPVSDLGGLHGDLRLMRERAWRPAAERLAAGAGAVVVAGIPARVAQGLVSRDGVVPAPTVEGAPAPLHALADLRAADRPARLIALEGGDGAAADVSELGYQVTRIERSPAVPYPKPPAVATAIPISLSAYERAFEAKVGLRAARCECGELSLPPRRLCLNCGRQDATSLVRLPDLGEVYSTVTIHAPLPGKSVPYSVAVVSLEGVPLRLLAPVTDAIPGSVRIGDRGRLVLRLLAEREGVDDYGYAFQPEPRA
jgi:uncharacterized OB-fold protein